MSQQGIAALGALGGPWNVAYHGAEQDAFGIGGFIRGAGFFGILSSFIYLIFFFSIFVKVMETNGKLKDEANIKNSEFEINKDKLSKDVRNGWVGIFWLTLFAGIFGFVALISSTIINEGFIGTGNSSVSSIMMWMTIIGGLGGTAISLALIIGYLIVMWPKTKNPKGGKSSSEVKEDQRLYNVIAPNNVMGIIMSIFYLFPVITILATEFDENALPRSNLANIWNR
jgi:hypothetical protein